VAMARLEARHQARASLRMSPKALKILELRPHRQERHLKASD